MKKIVAIVGMAGSGKSVVSDYLVSKGFEYLRFGQVVLDIVKEKNLKPTEENESKIREDLRKKNGMAAIAIINLPKIEKKLKKSNLVVDGLYSWSEYKLLKHKFNYNFIVISVYASPKTRYKRLAGRKLLKKDIKLRNRPATYEQAKKRDYAEIENIEKGGPIAMADFTIINEGSIEELKKSVDKIINKII